MDGDLEEIPGFRAGPVEGPVAGLDPVAASVGGGRVRPADSGEVDFRNLFAGVDAEVDLSLLALARFTAERSEGFAELTTFIGFGLGLGASERTIKTVSLNSDSQTIRREGLIRGIDLSYSLGSRFFLEIGYTLFRHAEVLRYEVGGVDYLEQHNLSIESGSGYGRMILAGYGSGNLEVFLGRYAWEGQYQLGYRVNGTSHSSNEYFLLTETLLGFGFRL